MLLSSESIFGLANILTGHTGITAKINKSEIDVIFDTALESSISDTYNNFFEGKTEILNSPMYSNTDFKLFNYTKLMLDEINGTSGLNKVILVYLSNLFAYTEQEEEVIQYLNEKFENDNYSIEKIEMLDEYKIYSLDECLVDYECLFNETERGNYILISEHNCKCYKKIKDKDYSGAITNSRSLLEQILREIQVEFRIRDGLRRGGYNGEIEPLLDDVLNKLNIKENLTGLPLKGYECLETGFKELISGISKLRHGMSDAHNISHPPTEKDALLVVNTVKTLANFIVKVYFEKFAYAV